MKKIILTILAGLILVGIGYLIIARPWEGRNEFGGTSFYTCKGIDSQTVYRYTACGFDSCSFGYFDQNGKVIERGQNGMVLNETEPTTVVSDCKEIKESEFIEQVQDYKPRV